MPFKNGTGPEGMGPMTGRQQGNCAVQPQANTPDQGQILGRGQGGLGRGQASGRKFGMGRGRWMNRAAMKNI